MATITRASIRKLLDPGLTEAAVARRMRVPVNHINATLRYGLELAHNAQPATPELLLEALGTAHRRQQVLLLMGGRCVACGFDAYPSSLRLHAVAGEYRAPNSNEVRDSAWGRLVEDMANCVLLCANCIGGLESRDLVIDDLVDAALGATRERLKLVKDRRGRATCHGIRFDARTRAA